MPLNLANIIYGFVSVLLSVLCWRYWMFVRTFKEFPSCRYEGRWFFRLITGRYFQNVPFVSVIHFEIMELCKTFYREGLCLIWFIEPILFVFNHEYVKILRNDESLIDKPNYYNILADVTGKGLFVRNGSDWRDRRKICNRAIRPELLKGQINIFNHCGEEFVKELSEVMDQPSVDLFRAIHHAVARSLFESFFGVQPNNKKYEQQIQKYTEKSMRIDDSIIYRMPRPWLYKRITRLLFQSGREYEKDLKELRSTIEYMTAEVMKSVTSPASSSPEDLQGGGKSPAYILIEQHLRDPSFTMEDVHGELRTFLMAGDLTVILAIQYCLFMLGVHPEEQEQAYVELHSVKGSDNTDISYDELNQLKYLECVIKETLRIYPVVSILERKPSREIECGKYRIPKGTQVMFVPWLLHRNPSIYPDPEKFDPERYYTNSLEHPWAYIPFAEGVRSCIGKNLAMIQMKTLLAHVLRNYEITCVDKKEDVKQSWQVFLMPLNPIHFKITRRKSRLLLQE